VGRLAFFLFGFIAPIVVSLLLVSVGLIKLARVLDPETLVYRVEMVSGLTYQILIGIWCLALYVQRFRNLGANPWLWTILTFVPLVNIYCIAMLLCAPTGNWQGRRFDFAGKLGLGLFIGIPIITAITVPALLLARADALRRSPQPIPPSASSALSESGAMPPMPDLSSSSLENRQTLVNPKWKQYVMDSVLEAVSAQRALAVPPNPNIKQTVLRQPTGPKGSASWSEMWTVETGSGGVGVIVEFQEDGEEGLTVSLDVEKSTTLPAPRPALTSPPPQANEPKTSAESESVKEILGTPGFMDRKYEFQKPSAAPSSR
jgi:hypothetical protein